MFRRDSMAAMEEGGAHYLGVQPRWGAITDWLILGPHGHERTEQLLDEMLRARAGDDDGALCLQLFELVNFGDLPVFRGWDQ